MKTKTLLCLVLAIVVQSLSAQTQQGYVKTKGRMVDGKHIPGQGLKGATVSIQGRTPVVVQSVDGSFSFPIPTQTFMVKSVQKNGYQLVDEDVVKKTYNYSSNPIYLVMETPERQLQDLLDSERKIRRNLLKQLKQKEEEIDALIEQGKISQEEYQKAMQNLYAAQRSNEKLISDMAKRYSELDYDQLDDFYQRVSYYIENGELTKADSMLLTRGNIVNQAQKLHKQSEAIIEGKKALEQAENVQKAEIDELAKRCYCKFETLLQQYPLFLDTASYYLEIRADLDTTNVEWQEDAATWTWNHYNKQILYTRRTINIYRALLNSGQTQYEPKLAQELGWLAMNYRHGDIHISLYGNQDEYQHTVRLDLSEALYKESAEIYQRLQENDPQYIDEYCSGLSSLAYVYKQSNRLQECEAIYKKIITNYQEAEKKHLIIGNDNYEHQYSLGLCFTNLGELYAMTNQLKESELMYKKALNSYYTIDIKNIRGGFSLNTAILGLANIYEKDNRQEEKIQVLSDGLNFYTEAVSCLGEEAEKKFEHETIELTFYLANAFYENHLYDSAESIYQSLYVLYVNKDEDDQGLYHYQELATIANRMINLFLSTGQLSRSIDMAIEVVNCYEWLVNNFNNNYLTNLANALFTLGKLYEKNKDFSKAYESFQEYISIIEESRVNDGETMNTEYAIALCNQSYYLLFMKDFTESERIAKVSLQINPSYSLTNTNLAAALLLQGKYAEAETIYRQYKDELKNSFLGDFEAFEKAGVIPKERKADVERIKIMLNE